MGRAFGGTWSLVSAEPAPDAAAIVARIVAEIDADMSPYRPSSALSRFNACTHSDWQDMPKALCAVSDAALEMARATDGAFDPTVGPLVRRFGFGPISGGGGPFEHIEVARARMRKQARTLTLDLCGIAKGYALDRISGALLGAGHNDFLLELGGEIITAGRTASNRNWRVAIEDPFSERLLARYIVEPRARALATSGHRGNGLLAPVATSHIIDPHAARPANGFAGSVSVLAETGIKADALATALAAMGQQAPHFAASRNIAALFVIGASSIGQDIMTGDFKAYIAV
ncbi:MAG: FAD:protein FMN transferase [Rhodobacteraceae bacterium]|nr:FAD:protein FMN transferase [Paracoccaceae bacterium]